MLKWLLRNTPGRPKCLLHPRGGRAGHSLALGALITRMCGRDDTAPVAPAQATSTTTPPEPAAPRTT